MDFAFVQKASAAGDASATSLNVSLTGVAANNLVAVWAKWEGADTTCSVSDATDTFTGATKRNHANGDLNGQWFYLLSSSSGNKTYTMTLGASRPFRKIHVWEFSYTGTASFDVESTNESASSTAITSGNITTTGTDEAVIGAYGEYSATAVSSHQINGVNADNTQQQSVYSWTWNRIVTATFTGAATASLPTARAWICNVISFKAAAAGGGTAVPVFRHHYMVQKR